MVRPSRTAVPFSFIIAVAVVVDGNVDGNGVLSVPTCPT